MGLCHGRCSFCCLGCQSTDRGSKVDCCCCHLAAGEFDTEYAKKNKHTTHTAQPTTATLPASQAPGYMPPAAEPQHTGFLHHHQQQQTLQDPPAVGYPATKPGYEGPHYPPVN